MIIKVAIVTAAIALAVYGPNTIEATPDTPERTTVFSLNHAANSQLMALDAEGY